MYKVSKDYKRFRELLDQGYTIVCFVDYIKPYERQERVLARSFKRYYCDGHEYYYYVGAKNTSVCCWDSKNTPTYYEESPDIQWKSINLSFIDPDYSRNDEEECF